MKKIFLFFALCASLFSCKKDTPEATVDITSVEVYGQDKVGAGQLIVLSAKLSDTTKQLDYKWNIDPLENLIGPDKKDANWFPEQIGPHTITFSISGSGVRPASKSLSVDVKKCDARYMLWHQSSFLTMLNEAHDKSELLSGTTARLIFKVVTQQRFNGWNKDRVQPGEFISYNFQNDQLVSAAVLLNNTHSYSESYLYYSDYVNLKNSRMSEYQKIRDADQWQSIPVHDYYTTHPQEIGRALTEGLVQFNTYYQTETTNILVTTGLSNGSILLGIVYEPL